MIRPSSFMLAFKNIGGNMENKELLTKIFDFVADQAMHNTPIDLANTDFNTRHYSIGKSGGRIEAFLEVMKFINKLREEQGN